MIAATGNTRSGAGTSPTPLNNVHGDAPDDRSCNAVLYPHILGRSHPLPRAGDDATLFSGQPEKLKELYPGRTIEHVDMWK